MKISVHKRKSAVALVITLLFLTVITFLAVAFLAMTSRDKSAVNASLDIATSQNMSEAALARAQSELMARMQSTSNILNYDYAISQNYISPDGFDHRVGSNNPINVNYDWIYTGPGTTAPFNPAFDPKYAEDWLQNIANLYYDPRPPVFVPLGTQNNQQVYDFRFWVDLNRNGRFETNGYVNALQGDGITLQPGATPFSLLENGEPQWIGMLKYPEYMHSATNPFIGRYAYMILPIGKQLDLNYINNHAKFSTSGNNDPTMLREGYVRNQGIGSWELNLAAVLNDVSPWFQTNLNGPYPYAGDYSYFYTPNVAFINSYASVSGVNFDASYFLRFRYSSNTFFPLTLGTAVGFPAPNAFFNLDEYGINAFLTYPYDYSGTPLETYPWSGTYSSNMFYYDQDLFNTLKTGPHFSNSLITVGSLLDTSNRYAYQRLLSIMGEGSNPEYGVYVYSNYYSTNITIPPSSGGIGYNPIPNQTLLRTKVNINYDNTAQIRSGPYSQNGNYTPMATNITTWPAGSGARGFFTNAADLLLRSQIFVFSNFVQNPLSGQYLYNNVGGYSNIFTTLSITNIPVYNGTNPGLVYNEQIHRMLQLAANIYAAANPVIKNGPNQVPVQYPPIFRPQFKVVMTGGTNWTVAVTNYALVTNDAYNQIGKGFYDPTNSAGFLKYGGDCNFWGVPWIVGAVKGLPAFDQVTYENQVYVSRIVQFFRRQSSSVVGQYAQQPPFQTTNQFYEMSLSNIFAINAWNPYSNAFYGLNQNLTVVAYNDMTVTITNNYNWGTNIYQSSLLQYPTPTNIGLNVPWLSHQHMTFLSNYFISLPPSYFSESQHNFVPVAIGAPVWLPADTNQHTYPTHYWSTSVSNHMYYALFDGDPRTSPNATLLDFVNLGNFGSYFPVTQWLINYDTAYGGQSVTHRPNYWTVQPATDAGRAQPPQGMINQIYDTESFSSHFAANMNGSTGCDGPTQSSFDSEVSPPGNIQAPIGTIAPSVNYTDSNIWMTCDPLVHYTLGDLTTPSNQIPTKFQIEPALVTIPMFLPTTDSQRYNIGKNYANQWNVVFTDPGMFNADYWQFPTNLFPNAGWLGRVHRGTPWETVYLKPDNPALFLNWTNLWVNSLWTYPTNDYQLVDLFTAVPNDNAARGLLSVNQTNSAAWAAVFAGVIALTNNSTVPGAPVGEPIGPGCDPVPSASTPGQIAFTNNVYCLMDYAAGTTNGINIIRNTPAFTPDGTFHKIGNILQASALTTSSSFLQGISAQNLTDQMVERIPQQTLGLLKLGMPQFVIYSWGQSLKPAQVYSGNLTQFSGLCTNYEITGEYSARMVCHLVSTDGTMAAPKLVVDSYNILPSY